MTAGAPLRSAAWNGEFWRIEPLCKELNEKGVSLYAQDREDKNRKTALHCAAFRGHCSTVDALCKEYEAKGLALNVKDRRGFTPLQIAVEGGRANSVECLCKAYVRTGVALDEKNDKGESALHEAAKRRNLDIVKVLCKEYKAIGLPCNEKSRAGQTPLHIAIYRIDPDQLKEEGKGVSMEIVTYGQCFETVKELCTEFCANCYPLDEKDGGGRTPFILAAHLPNHKPMELLRKEYIARGILLNVKDPSNVSALCAAANRIFCPFEVRHGSYDWLSDDDMLALKEWSDAGFFISSRVHICEGYGAGWG